MYESKQEITDVVEAIYALTQRLNRGQTLTHLAIQSVLGVRPHEGSWEHVMRKVRRRLREERGIATWPDHTIGYKLCTVVEQLALPTERTRRGLRQVRRGRREVEALPEKSLSANQRRARFFLSDRLKTMEAGLRRDLMAQREEIAPTPTLPRRPQPVA